MDNVKTTTYKMVKSEDLNHHGTLYAGRCSEWFVESSFIEGARFLDPHNIVCLKIHGLEFLHPSKVGSILGFESQIVHAGRTSVTIYTKVYDMKSKPQIKLDGFVTFCHVDAHGKATPHGLVYVPKSEEEKLLNEKAIELLKR